MPTSRALPRKADGTVDKRYLRGSQRRRSHSRKRTSRSVSKSSQLKNIKIVWVGTTTLVPLVKKSGVKVQSRVGRNTDYVVVYGNKLPHTQKIADAKKYGVKIISHHSFFKKFKLDKRN
jgi:NAD-dependent DNA ligase